MWIILFSAFSVLGLFSIFNLYLIQTIESKSKWYLAILFFVVSVILIELCIELAGFYTNLPHSIYTTIPFWSLINVFFFLYITDFLSIKQPRYILTLHFLPFIYSLYNLHTFYGLSGDTKLSIAHYVSPHPSLGLTQYMFTAQGLFYCILLLVFFKQKRTELSTQHTKWLSWLIYGFLFYIIFDLTVGIALTTINLSTEFRFFSIAIMSVFLFSASILVVHHPFVLSQQIKTVNLKYATSRLTAERASEIFQNTKQFIEQDKRYLDSNLRPAQVAESLNISTHTLSQALNQFAKTSFTELLNSYRVKEVIQQLRVTDLKKVNLFSVGLDAGFASKSSFNRVFKQTMGVAPSVYLKNVESAPK